MINLEETVVRKVKTIHHNICTVESCTGGLIAHLITNVPGASEVFWGGRVVYDDSVKKEIGVPEATLTQFGAVSYEVAKELSERGLELMKNNRWRKDSHSLIKPRGFICLATTGIAGPGGGTGEKPVGLCYIALAMTGRPTIIEAFHSSSKERTQVKNDFAQKALDLIRSNV